MRTLLIAEAVPLRERKLEVVVLGEFIRMCDEGFKDDYFFECKKDFLDYLDRYVVDPHYNKKYGRYKYVHFSGHGCYYKSKGAKFSFPKGDLAFDELPKDCFSGMVVTFSACDLGKKVAMEQFAERTKSKYVIAPFNSPRFEDAALWYVNFYYLIFRKKFRPLQAYDMVNSMFDIEADFKIYPNNYY